MVKAFIIGLAALGYVHYVHTASLAVNRRLDTLRAAYASPGPMLDYADTADLTLPRN